MSRISTILVMLSALLLSCATSKFIQTGNIYPSYNGTVKVFFESPPDSIEFVEIGIVSSIGTAGMATEWTHLIKAMQSKAALYGANAIIVITKESDKQASITYIPKVGLYGGTRTDKTMMARAIRIINN